MTQPRRSIHNTRIERLWGDLTQALGKKWKDFFMDLEMYHGLNPRRTGHIWMIHHLFLSQINQDVEDFVYTWNHHMMQIRGQRTASPREMFFFGMVSRGTRGLEEEDIDVQSYGIDWDDLADRDFVTAVRARNQDEPADPLDFRPPEHRAEVVCLPPTCPFTAEEITRLDAEILHQCGANVMRSRNMMDRRAVWVAAMQGAQAIVCEYSSFLGVQTLIMSGTA